MSKRPTMKKCSCCGGYAGRWVQWPNRDTGWGVCMPCIHWLKGRHTSDEEIESNYGTQGVHYGTDQEFNVAEDARVEAMLRG